MAFSLAESLSWDHGSNLIRVPNCRDRLAINDGLGWHIHGKRCRGMYGLHLIHIVVADDWDLTVGAAHVYVRASKTWIRYHWLLDHLLSCCFLASSYATNKRDREPESKCHRKPYWESKLSCHVTGSVSTWSATAGACRRFFSCWWCWSICFCNDLQDSLSTTWMTINEWLNFLHDGIIICATSLAAPEVFWAILN